MVPMYSYVVPFRQRAREWFAVVCRSRPCCRTDRHERANERTAGRCHRQGRRRLGRRGRQWPLPDAAVTASRLSSGNTSVDVVFALNAWSEPITLTFEPMTMPLGSGWPPANTYRPEFAAAAAADEIQKSLPAIAVTYTLSISTLPVGASATPGWRQRPCRRRNRRARRLARRFPARRGRRDDAAVVGAVGEAVAVVVDAVTRTIVSAAGQPVPPVSRSTVERGSIEVVEEVVDDARDVHARVAARCPTS